MTLETFLSTIAALSGLLFVVASMLGMGRSTTILYNKYQTSLDASVSCLNKGTGSNKS
jgi:hypothetical protein